MKSNSYNWDYNTWYNCHYYGKYGHIGENCLKTHFRGKSKSWMNASMVCYRCNKIGHLKKYCRSPIPRNDQSMNEDISEKLRNQMNKTWKKKEEGSISEASAPKVTQSDGSGDHTSLN